MSELPRTGRALNEARPVVMETGFHSMAEGSVLYRCGRTVVLITASIDNSVPDFLVGKGQGWVTAEYQMHPRCNPKRRERREGREKPLKGRTQEIQRLIGRALRAAVDLERLGERSLTIDADVLEADGGTRTASITGAWVALALAVAKLQSRGELDGPVLVDQVAAISVGHVAGEPRLDLDYREDSSARVDMNVVATAKGELVELQGTAEGRPVPRAEMDRLTDLGLEGVAWLCAKQREALTAAGVELGAVLIG